MPGAIDRIARNAVEIVESLRQIGPGQLRCVRCGHTADESEFKTVATSRPSTRHRDRRLCPSCKSDIDTWGHVDYGTAHSVLLKH